MLFKKIHFGFETNIYGKGLFSLYFIPTIIFTRFNYNAINIMWLLWHIEIQLGDIIPEK